MFIFLSIASVLQSLDNIAPYVFTDRNIIVGFTYGLSSFKIIIWVVSICTIIECK